MSSVEEKRNARSLTRPFVVRRLHSLLGLWLVVYLCLHLFVNAQAALFFYDNGRGFVAAVNRLESLPYLKFIELLFLGLPFAIHGLWGIRYAWRGRLNAHRTDGKNPALPQYTRNKAYSWQRITAWFLVIAIIVHVIDMRFWSYPSHNPQGHQELYMVRLSGDAGLPLVANKLGVRLYDESAVIQKREDLVHDQQELLQMEKERVSGNVYSALHDKIVSEKKWIEAADKKPLRRDEWLGVSPNPGGAFFLLLRDTFKRPIWVFLYSLFVIAASYHAFNGVWTWMISWEVTLNQHSQRLMLRCTNAMMGIVTILGLFAVWGTYLTI